MNHSLYHELIFYSPPLCACVCVWCHSHRNFMRGCAIVYPTSYRCCGHPPPQSRICNVIVKPLLYHSQCHMSIVLPLLSWAPSSRTHHTLPQQLSVHFATSALIYMPVVTVMKHLPCSKLSQVNVLFSEQCLSSCFVVGDRCLLSLSCLFLAFFILFFV